MTQLGINWTPTLNRGSSGGPDGTELRRRRHGPPMRASNRMSRRVEDARQDSCRKDRLPVARADGAALAAERAEGGTRSSGKPRQ